MTDILLPAPFVTKPYDMTNVLLSTFFVKGKRFCVIQESYYKKIEMNN